MTETAEIARAYLTTFLPQHRADELTREIVDDVGPDADRTALVGAAHERLSAEVRVTDVVAADVLVRELGMTSDEAADVLGVTTEQVVSAVDQATSIEQELQQELEQRPRTAPTRPRSEEATLPADRAPPIRYVFDTEAPPAQEEGTSELTGHAPVVRAGSRRIGFGTVAVGVLVAIAVGVAIAMSMTGSSGDDAADDGANVAGEITVTDSRITDRMDEEGPGPAREVFAPDDPVILWFSYEPVAGRPDVELALLRDGEELISPSFPLPEGRTDLRVPLPHVVTEDPGAYTVELRGDGRVLVRTGFRVEAQ